MNAKKTRQERKNAKAKNPQPISQNKEGQLEIQTKEQKEDSKNKKLQQKLQNKLNEIREFIGDRNYIFRGENNKNYGKISSKLYRYFQIIAVQAELQKSDIVLDFSSIQQPLESQLKKQIGKSAQNIDFPTLEKSLKENILAQLAQKINYPLIVEGIQKELILREVQEHVDFEKEIDTLAELQHYGGSTNRIDFSYDLAVALFFACDGEPKKDGRLILLRRDAKDIIPPKKNQNNRTVFQKSVFVKRDDGYIDEKEEGEKIRKFTIPQNLKPLLLTYVQNYFGIRTETMYGDLIGYIQNQERHSEAYKQFFAGSIYSIDKNSKEEIKCYEEAIKLKPNFAEAYFNRGVVYGKEKNYDPAIADYTKAIELNPKHAKAYNNRGHSYSYKGEYDLAIADYSEAIARNPDAMIYNNRGIAFNNKRYYDLAIADYTKAIDMDPNYAMAYNNRGIAYNRKDEPDRAIADYTKAIELDPSYAIAYSNRGIDYNNKGEYDRAIADFDKSIELDPNNAKTYNNRSTSYFRKDNYDRAIVECNKAIELDPNYAEAYANRGIAKRNLRKKGAKKDLETALQLAKEQENEVLVADIQKEIDKSLDDSNL